MTARKYTLVEIVRDPRILVCEASELTKDGHYYLYRYHGSEGHFYRATVPSGAAGMHFQVLKTTDKIPLGGWRVVERSNLSKGHLKLISQKGKRPGGPGTNRQG